jgi:hypothetical protein
MVEKLDSIVCHGTERRISHYDAETFRQELAELVMAGLVQSQVCLVINPASRATLLQGYARLAVEAGERLWEELLSRPDGFGTADCDRVRVQSAMRTMGVILGWWSDTASRSGPERHECVRQAAVTARMAADELTKALKLR